tara:strand:- start:321 stop:530 length:210 start_codon:yes stop_codon:yes gene_type:complete
MQSKDHILQLRNIKRLSGVRINKAQSAIDGDRLSDALMQIERQRELNTRMSYEITKLESHLRDLKVLNK